MKKAAKAVGKKAHSPKAKSAQPISSKHVGKIAQSAPRKGTKAVARKTVSAKEEKRKDLNALLVSMRIYFQSSSRAPLEDWQEIENYVEEGLGLSRLRERLRASQVEVVMPKFKEEPMPESTAVSTAGDANRPMRSPSLNQLLNAVVDNPDAWLSMPSAQFGGRKPADLLGTEEEHKIVDLLLAVDQGLF